MKTLFKPLLITLLTLLIIACDTKEDPTPTGELVVRVRNTNGAGDEPARTILWVWPVEEPGYSVASAIELLNNNWARDSRNVPLESIERQERFTGVFQPSLPPGKYLVAAMLNESPQGRYSYTTTSVSEGQQTELSKVFTGAAGYSEEAW